MNEPLPAQPEPAEQSETYRALVAEIVSALTIVRDLPGLADFRSTRTLPRVFFDQFNAFLSAYDRLIDFVLGFSGDDTRIKCTKGCANCCVDLVRGMTTPETVNIYHHVRNWPDVRALFEYHKESAELFVNILMATMQPDEGGGRDPRIAEAHLDYNRQGRPCGFLDQKTGACRIYAVRPLACRFIFSLDPPETCSPLNVLYLERRTRTVHLPEEVHRLIREIDHRFGFRPLNYLSGAFCQFAAETMRTKPITVTD